MRCGGNTIPARTATTMLYPAKPERDQR